jgi:ankyrin repeat protein
MVQVLLKYGADVNARNSNGGTPLHYIFVRPPPTPTFPQSPANVARVLLEHGADVNACSAKYSKPLHLAVRRKMVELVRVLLERAVFTRKVTVNCNYFTPLVTNATAF